MIRVASDAPLFIHGYLKFDLINLLVYSFSLLAFFQNVDIVVLRRVLFSIIGLVRLLNKVSPVS